MKFKIEKGVEVLALSKTDQRRMMVGKTTVKEKVYYEKDLLVDPFGTIGSHKGSINIGGQFARDGLYGFALPENHDGYYMMLVHEAYVKDSRKPW